MKRAIGERNERSVVSAGLDDEVDGEDWGRCGSHLESSKGGGGVFAVWEGDEVGEEAAADCRAVL